jgi:hypothetical protein
VIVLSDERIRELNLLMKATGKPICPYDGKVCDGVWVMGALSCSIIEFGSIVKGGGMHIAFECPRLKRKGIVPK